MDVLGSGAFDLELGFVHGLVDVKDIDYTPAVAFFGHHFGIFPTS